MKEQSPLEKTFNLPSLEDIDNELKGEDDLDAIDGVEMSEQEFNTQLSSINSDLEELKRSEIDLALIENISEYNRNMSDIHDKAITNFQDIMATVMAMEPSHGAKFLVGATKLLEIAKDAQNTSLDRLIRLSKLEMEKEKHKAEMKGLVKPPKTIGEYTEPSEDNEDVVNEDVVIIEDRNTIIEKYFGDKK